MTTTSSHRAATLKRRSVFSVLSYRKRSLVANTVFATIMTLAMPVAIAIPVIVTVPLVSLIAVSIVTLIVTSIPLVMGHCHSYDFCRDIPRSVRALHRYRINPAAAVPRPLCPEVNCQVSGDDGILGRDRFVAGH